MKLCLGATSEGDESTSLAGLLTVAGARPPIDSTGGH